MDRLVRMPPEVRYRTDPVGWAVDVLGVRESSLRWSLNDGYASRTWDGTPDPIAGMLEGLAAGQDVGVESGVATGKTFGAAIAALWFIACWEDALVITTAPKEQQLTAQLWKEIGLHWPRFQARYPMASMVQLRVRLREGAGEQERWGILGYACGVGAAEDSATKAQGFHAAHMLIITEETPGIDPAVMAAFANTSSGDHNLRLALGNPDSQYDALHQFCLERGVLHIRASALDHPNVVCGSEVIAGAAGVRSVEKQTQRWGNGSPMWNSRVRGISPSESSDALIKVEWCESAAGKYKDPRYRSGVRSLGVDVAQSENGDRAAIARGVGACLVEVETFPCPNATELGKDIAREVKEHGIAANRVGVDPIGVGAATINELRVSVGAVQALNGGASPVDGAQMGPDGQRSAWAPDANEHRNLRSQMYWQLREDLRNGRVALKNDPELFRQLTSISYRIINGEVRLESKDDLRKRLGRSPDHADAVVYWNWVRDRSVLEPVTGPSHKKENRGRRFDFASGKVMDLTSEDMAKEFGMETEASKARNGMFIPTVPRW